MTAITLLVHLISYTDHKLVFLIRISRKRDDPVRAGAGDRSVRDGPPIRPLIAIEKEFPWV
jgi:hypothetical protein